MEKPRYYFIDDRKTANIDFSNLGFDYIPCPYRFEAVFNHGIWRARGLIEDRHAPPGGQPESSLRAATL